MPNLRIQFTTGLICLMAVVSYAKAVRVIDKTTLRAIENTYIFSKERSVVTDNRGEADLNIFNEDDILTFQHPSYKLLSLPYKDVEKVNFIIKLNESVININEVVVSANRWEQNKEEVPNRITTISAKKIAFTNPQTAADLLGATNEVYIQKSQMGGGSPMIRGFATNRILLVVDGVRMNNAIYRSGNLQNVISLDANSIENSEVIFGPGSVMYGSDAIGGVIDFHTLRPKFSTSEKVNFSGNALTRFASANKEKTGHFDFNIRINKWSFLSGITYSDFDDLKMGSHGRSEYVRKEYVKTIDGLDQIIRNSNENVQRSSGYSQLNFMQKIRFRPNEKWDVNYGFHYSGLSNVPRYDRLIQYKGDKLKYAEWYYGPQKWMMNVLNVRYTNSAKLFDEAKIVAAYQDYEESRNDRKYEKVTRRERTENVGAFSLNIDFDKKLDEKSSLFYGLEAVTNKIHSTGLERNIRTGENVSISSRYPDNSDYTSYAAYMNYKINFNKKLTLITGARYSRVLLNADFNTEFFDFPFNKLKINTGALNGSIGLVYKPEESWKFNLNASTGFRAPNIDDAGKIFDSEPGNVVVPNNDLDSEYAYNIDWGVSKTFANRFQFDATCFYTRLNDAMVRKDYSFNGQDSILYDGEMSRVQALVNANQAYVYGMQLSLYAEIVRNLVLKTNLTYTKGEEQDAENHDYVPLRHVTPLFGSTHLIYSTDRLRADFYANYNGEIKNKSLAPSEQSKPYIYATDKDDKPYSPSWFTLNFKASYQIDKYLQANIGVENILDIRYRPYSSGIVAPGRNIMVGIRGSF